MNAKVVDLAPHEWCEMSTSSDLRVESKKPRENGWALRCVVALVSAGVGFCISTADGARAPVASARHGTVSVVAVHAPSSGARSTGRHQASRDSAKSRASAAVRAAVAESEKTRWEMAGWAVRR